MFFGSIFIFQMFYSEIEALPKDVVGKASQLPILLSESRASITVSNNRTWFLRFKVDVHVVQGFRD